MTYVWERSTIGALEIESHSSPIAVKYSRISHAPFGVIFHNGAKDELSSALSNTLLSDATWGGVSAAAPGAENYFARSSKFNLKLEFGSTPGNSCFRHTSTVLTFPWIRSAAHFSYQLPQNPWRAWQLCRPKSVRDFTVNKLLGEQAFVYNKKVNH